MYMPGSLERNELFLIAFPCQSRIEGKTLLMNSSLAVLKEKLKDDFFPKCPKTATGGVGRTVDSLNYMIHG